MPSSSVSFTREQYLRALPKHVLLALVCGAISGVLIWWIKAIPIEGSWRLGLLFPLVAVYVTGAILPLAIPGRHWGFAFISGMMLLLMLMAGFVLSETLWLPHSAVPGGPALAKVNALSIGAIVTGACLGLFYGLLSDRRSAMFAGLGAGAATGYVLGLASLDLVTHTAPPHWDVLRYTGSGNFAWLGAGAFALLHLAACIGAMLGASKSK